MKKWILVSALVSTVPMVVWADHDDTLVRFEGGIGVDPVSGISSSNAPTPNTVRGVSPGGAPWHIRDLSAEVSVSGHIVITGRGLVLAGGNNIGSSLGLSVHADLFCGAGSTTPIDTTSVTLNVNGDFHIDEHLPSAPPNPCVAPVLLIATADPNGRWLAAGIPRVDLDEK
jgi:hypothetical protein